MGTDMKLTSVVVRQDNALRPKHHPEHLHDWQQDDAIRWINIEGATPPRSSF
jgi:hypothetical protein